MTPIRPDEPESPIVDLRSRMKPPTTVREFMERAMADPKERRAIEKLTDKMRAEQDAPPSDICLRCGRKAGFVLDIANEDEGWVSDCCGFPAVDPTREPE